MTYTVTFEHAGCYAWFYTRVYHGESLIAEKSCCRSYRRSVRWAKRRIRDHREALTKLEAVVPLLAEDGAA